MGDADTLLAFPFPFLFSPPVPSNDVVLSKFSMVEILSEMHLEVYRLIEWIPDQADSED